MCVSGFIVWTSRHVDQLAHFGPTYCGEETKTNQRILGRFDATMMNTLGMHRQRQQQRQRTTQHNNRSAYQ